MGLFDKIKAFAGGSSMVKVEFVDIENQTPNDAKMPISDSVIKGRYRIVAQKDCTVLRHIAQFRTRWPEKDGTLGTMHAEDINDVKNQVIGAPYQFPYDLKVGQTMDSGFIIVQLDIPSYLQKYGIGSMEPQVEAFIKTIIDVKGSPFDPEFEQKIAIV
jgi:hypothetical protein